MRVNVIRGGEAGFDALLYGPPTEAMLEYINNGMTNTMRAISNVSETFMNTVTDIYNRFSSNDAIQFSKSLLNQAGVAVGQDIIHYVPIGRLFNANLEMQQYIMSDLAMRELYDNQSCHGYQETYFDIEPNTPAQERMMYMDVMDGVSGSEDWMPDTNTFYTYGYDERKVLDTYDKIAIIETWSNVRKMIASGYDPSSQDGEEL